ncbi:MAG: ATP-binding cassette domain-containing protein [Chloroflexota bacterium]|nr:ATP-binding cassette domain-containing protein [Chloroflexota bacterium]
MRTTAERAGASVAGVSFAFPGAAEAVLDRVGWEIAAGSFTVVAGPSGSGKSTLLRCLNGLVPHYSGGRFGGEVRVHGLDTRRSAPRLLAHHVGFVSQDPETQLVMPRVDEEIAFGLERRGVPRATMRQRVEDVLVLLGIAHLRHRETATLSGGERQRVAVAAALALQPSILVLDEPTSQLDPHGAEDVIAALNRLNEDLGLAVVLAEHRLERVVAHADRMRFVAGPGVTPIDGSPAAVLSQMDPVSVPPVVALGRAMGWDPLPLTVRAARAAAEEDGRRPASPPADPAIGGEPVVRVAGLATGYGPRTVLRGVDLDLRPGELVALVGRNGIGKTTLLRSLVGLHRPVRGTVRVGPHDAIRTETATLARVVGYVPQQPDRLFFAPTVREELAFTRHHLGAGGEDIDALLDRLDLAGMAERNPRDLSGGERQRAALAAILAGGPRVLLLDEPTRGMDAAWKRSLGAMLRRWCAEEGMAVLMATHDIELVARFATRVVMLGDGEVIADGPPREVLPASLSFAPQINRVYGGSILTVEDVVGGLGPRLG